MVILVSLKTDDDGSGSALLACTGIAPDPLLPETHLLCTGVTGLSWPFASAWVHTKQWSVPKTSLHWYMAGPLLSSPSLTLENLGQGSSAKIPHLVGTLPAQALDTNPAAIQKLVAKEDVQARRAAEAVKAMRKGAADRAAAADVAATEETK